MLQFCAQCFTRMERRVMSAMLLDPTIKGQMQILNLSMRSVKDHRRNICRKFRVSSCEELLLCWLRIIAAGAGQCVHAIAHDNKRDVHRIRIREMDADDVNRMYQRRAERRRLEREVAMVGA
jgi:hypothetical protein